LDRIPDINQSTADERERRGAECTLEKSRDENGGHILANGGGDAKHGEHGHANNCWPFASKVL
jgi:hypothetical protein